MPYFLFQLTYFCAVAFCSYTTGWLLIRARRNQMVWALAACQLLVVIWCVPKLLFPYSATLAMQYGLYAVSYIGISLIGPAWLLFSFLYCGRKIALKVRVLLFGAAAFDYGMFLTNGLHHLFYREFELGHTVYGPFLYIHMLYTYGCVLLGVGVVLREFWKKRVAVIHMVLIILAAVVPLSINLLYIFRLLKSDQDLTPTAFALSSFLMFLAVFRHDLLDINVLAFEQILRQVAEGVLVYNKRGVVTYCNQAAEDWLGVQVGEDIGFVDEKLRAFGAQMEENGPAVSQVLTLPDGGRVRLKRYICPDRKGAMAAGTLVLTDVGEYYALLQQSRELAVSEQRLAIEQERNRIAQEVHDTTGHTLTMIRSLIKLIRVACEEQGRTGAGRERPVGEKESTAVEREAMAGAGRERLAGEKESAAVVREAMTGAGREQLAGEQEGRLVAGETMAGEKEDRAEDSLESYIDQAQALAAEGIRQLRLSINHMRQGTGHELVTQGVYQLAESVKELKVEVEIQGKDGPAYSHLSGIIYGCLREAITNCLRYAKASRMDVIVKFAGQDVSLYIFDDGQGCADIRESHGLWGIRERAEKAGGQVRFLSAKGEGFQIYMKLPLEKKSTREGGNI